MRAVQSHAYCKNDTCARKLLNGVDHCGTAGNEAVNCNNMKINIYYEYGIYNIMLFAMSDIRTTNSDSDCKQQFLNP